MRDYELLVLIVLDKLLGLAKENAVPRRKGKWERLENGRYMCSECGCLENNIAWGNKERHSFCWNCGADMRMNPEIICSEVEE